MLERDRGLGAVFQLQELFGYSSISLTTAF